MLTLRPFSLLISVYLPLDRMFDATLIFLIIFSIESFAEEVLDTPTLIGPKTYSMLVLYSINQAPFLTPMHRQCSFHHTVHPDSYHQTYFAQP